MNATQKLNLWVMIGSLFFFFLFLAFVFGGEGGNHPFITWFSLIVSCSGAVYIYNKSKEMKQEELTSKRDETDDRLKRIPNYKSSQKYVSANGEVTLAIDEKNKQIVFVNLNSSRDKTYSYRDILKSEILTDGVSVTSTNRGSQLGGALIGGLLAGGVGALIGGLSGSTTNQEKVRKIELNVIVNDTAIPLHKISFLDSPFLTYTKDSNEYKNGYETAYHCHQLIGVLIRQADEEDKRNEIEASKGNDNSQGSLSVADELRKLVQLKDEGIINIDEFESQKKKLIG